MEWYYAEAGEKIGPVTDSQLEELVRTGVVKSDTLVWRIGQARGIPYSQTRPTVSAPSATVRKPKFPKGIADSQTRPTGKPPPLPQPAPSRLSSINPEDEVSNGSCKIALQRRHESVNNPKDSTRDSDSPQDKPYSKNPFNYKGRIGRGSFLCWNILTNCSGLIMAVFVFAIFGKHKAVAIVLLTIIGAVWLFCGTSLIVKRLHDCNLSGDMLGHYFMAMFFLFVVGLAAKGDFVEKCMNGISIIASLALVLVPGTSGSNEYGKPPK